MLTKREQYQISFIRKVGPYDTTSSYATTTNPNSYSIAGHLSYSDLIHTKSQINAIENVVNRKLSGLNVQNLWGEVFGSQLYIDPTNDRVIVGFDETTLPIQDFKQLLEEWQMFLNQF